MIRTNVPILYMVLPCYNEEDVIKGTIERVTSKLKELQQDNMISFESKMVFVDDGSNDKTWQIIRESTQENSYVEGISLSKNSGHQTAIYAGMEISKNYADIIVTIDADLQQDINTLSDFIIKYNEGYDIVYGVRRDRKTDGIFKKISATIYYGLMKKMGAEIIPQSADYRLLSKRAVEALCQYKETNLFIRGIVPSLGFNSTCVHFDVKERTAGSSKYTLKKMIKLALDGITSFSITPIRVAFYFGIIVALISAIVAVYDIAMFLKGITLPGWTSITVSIWFLGGVQLIFLGIIGEYVGRTYIETKKRPRFFLKETTFGTNDKTVESQGMNKNE